jgi:hypothetical protein
MKNEIVISRFKEDLSWTRNLHDLDYKVTVYNKFEGQNLLQNVGKESHTYLTHIVNNYDNLADITVFLQGDPFAHCSDILQTLNDMQHLTSKIQYYGLSDGLIICDGNGRPHCGKNHLPLAKLYEYLFNLKSPEVFVCNPAGQFAVKNDVIYRNSKSLYEKALNTLTYDVNPIEGFCMERMWTSLFGFTSDMKRTQINYDDDVNINEKDYNNVSTDFEGNFINLGVFGFRSDLDAVITKV